jgi:hypothetical protein
LGQRCDAGLCREHALDQHEVHELARPELLLRRGRAITNLPERRALRVTDRRHWGVRDPPDSLATAGGTRVWVTHIGSSSDRIRDVQRQQDKRCESDNEWE